MIAPFFAELANKFTDAIFLRVDVNELKVKTINMQIKLVPLLFARWNYVSNSLTRVTKWQRVALDCAIETLPTFIFLRQGNIVDRVVGARKDMLPKKIELHMRNWMLTCSISVSVGSSTRRFCGVRINICTEFHRFMIILTMNKLVFHLHLRPAKVCGGDIDASLGCFSSNDV